MTYGKRNYLRLLIADITTVLINKLNIRNQAELDAVEKQITLLRGTQAEQGTEFVNVDFEFYKSLH